MPGIRIDAPWVQDPILKVINGFSQLYCHSTSLSFPFDGGKQNCCRIFSIGGPSLNERIAEGGEKVIKKRNEDVNIKKEQ